MQNLEICISLNLEICILWNYDDICIYANFRRNFFYEICILWNWEDIRILQNLGEHLYLAVFHKNVVNICQYLDVTLFQHTHY